MIEIISTALIILAVYLTIGYIITLVLDHICYSLSVDEFFYKCEYSYFSKEPGFSSFGFFMFTLMWPWMIFIFLGTYLVYMYKNTSFLHKFNPFNPFKMLHNFVINKSHSYRKLQKAKKESLRE